ncbi:hypothetical protein CSV79_16300 [Sporosarcina sp. P13]|uniref:hypothetical protein n=1 Tax=Sporosarcina sp. P13 TaxID=2048263 RepID=UPI000C16B348|nr:hypothetical protein [Sporosarcina sp. P13]PIC62580.1 hypothetical protein CSV79_16300 [Sporosarcina sp. P13]
MSLSKNKYVTVVLLIALTLLLAVTLLIASASYLNTKEIGALSLQCHENSGEQTLEIHNILTSKYSFECR